MPVRPRSMHFRRPDPAFMAVRAWWKSTCRRLNRRDRQEVSVKKIIGLSVLICVAAFAQEKGRGGGRPAAVGGGHIPARGPAPAQASKPARAATPARGQQAPAVPENRIRAD